MACPYMAVGSLSARLSVATLSFVFLSGVLDLKKKSPPNEAKFFHFKYRFGSRRDPKLAWSPTSCILCNLLTSFSLASLFEQAVVHYLNREKGLDFRED